jgi:hypothetical protein
LAEPVDRAQSEYAALSFLSRGGTGAHLGRREEACEQAHAGLELNPSFTIARFRSQTVSDNPLYLAGRERVYEGLRKTGLPEE